MVRSWWLYVGVSLPLYFLFYFGLKGLGIVNYGYNYNIGYTPSNNSLIQIVLSFTPLPQIAPVYLVVSIIGVAGLYFHYFKSRKY